MTRPIENVAAEIRAMLARATENRSHPDDALVLDAALAEAARMLDLDTTNHDTRRVLSALRDAGLDI